MSSRTRALDSIRRRYRAEEKHFNALSTALALVQMDPYAKEDLAIYLADAQRAAAANDAEALDYILNAIVEIFTPADMSKALTHEQFEAKIRRMPGGAEAFAAVKSAKAEFRKRYLAAKAASGYRTIRELAKAAGLSPTTVQAIEKGSLTPQWRTLQSLCKAFNKKLPRGKKVSAADLWT